jgi:hypothetical protein
MTAEGPKPLKQILYGDEHGTGPRTAVNSDLVCGAVSQRKRFAAVNGPRSGHATCQRSRLRRAPQTVRSHELSASGGAGLSALRRDSPSEGLSYSLFANSSYAVIM